MNLQYITNVDGNRTAVLIPIEEWESLIDEYKKRDKPTPKLSEKYAGKLPASIADELQAHIARGRNE
jgi:PHD/YefM family antitoxin component YafN of YafNO toxin-antitoxin module